MKNIRKYIFLEKTSQGIVFKVFIQPKSSKNIITGIYTDAIKIKLKAAPFNGAANKMCIKFIAKCLKVPKTSIEIISGHTSRTKYLLYKKKDEDIEVLKKEFAKLLNE